MVQGDKTSFTCEVTVPQGGCLWELLRKLHDRMAAWF